MDEQTFSLVSRWLHDRLQGMTMTTQQATELMQYLSTLTPFPAVVYWPFEKQDGLPELVAVLSRIANRLETDAATFDEMVAKGRGVSA